MMIDELYFENLRLFVKNSIENLRSVNYSKLREGISHSPIISKATYSPWKDDVEFITIYDQITGHTLVDIYRCYELWKLTLQLNVIEGDIVEVGVWRGGTGAILAYASKDAVKSTNVYLCDTFKGVVKAGTNDTIYKGGEHADTSITTVEQLLNKIGVSNYKICEGIYPDKFAPMFSSVKIKLLHIDVDTYQSAKEVFEFSWDKIVSGGMVVFDDYGFWGCEGVTELFNEMELSNAIKIYNVNGHGILIKK